MHLILTWRDGDLNPLIIHTVLLPLYFIFMLRKLLFFLYNMFIWGFILNKTFFSYNVEHRGFSFVEILLCLTDGKVICESYVV